MKGMWKIESKINIYFFNLKLFKNKERFILFEDKFFGGRGYI